MDRAWRLLDDGAGEPAFNMAVDETLLERGRLQGAPPILRLYAWAPPAVSLGRFQAEGDEEIPEALRGHARVRRTTGGGAILHRDEITFAVAAPLDALGGEGAGVETSFFAVNRAIARGLALLGVTVDAIPEERDRVAERSFSNSPAEEKSSPSPTLPGEGKPLPEPLRPQALPGEGKPLPEPLRPQALPGEGKPLPEPLRPQALPGEGKPLPEPLRPQALSPFLCFARRSRTDLTVGGAKLVGSAQRRRHRWALQHGSIPLGLEEEVAAAPRPATLARAAGRRIGYDEAARALARGFEEAFGARLEREPADEAERRRAEALACTGGGSWPTP